MIKFKTMKKLLNVFIFLLIVIIIIVMQIENKPEENKLKLEDIDYKTYIVKTNKQNNIKKRENNVTSIIVHNFNKKRKLIKPKENNELKNIEFKKLELFYKEIDKKNFFNVLKEFEKLDKEIKIEKVFLEKIRIDLIKKKIEKYPTLREQFAKLLENKYSKEFLDIIIYVEGKSLFIEGEPFKLLKNRRKIYFEQKENLEMMNFKNIKYEIGGPTIKRYRLYPKKEDNEL